MQFLTSGVFWGSLLVLWGISTILNAMFHLHIPFFRIALGLIIIWFGVNLLMGKKGGCCLGSAHETVVSGETPKRDYNIIFGRGEIDLTGAKPEKGREIEVNAIFGHAIVKVSSKTPVRVKGSAVFGNVEFPDGNSIAFGDRVFETEGGKKGGAALEIEANAVFGRLEIQAK